MIELFLYLFALLAILAPLAALADWIEGRL